MLFLDEKLWSVFLIKIEGFILNLLLFDLGLIFGEPLDIDKLYSEFIYFIVEIFLFSSIFILYTGFTFKISLGTGVVIGEGLFE